MSATLESIAAISPAAIIAAAGAWRGEITLRLQSLVEERRNDQARRENALHRQRFAEVWHFWHDQPDDAAHTQAARWYSTWTGARPPLDPGADGPLTPGFGCRDADEACERYLGSLEAKYGHLERPAKRPKVPQLVLRAWA